MFCSQCGEKILGKPVKQANESFCSLECANAASGVDPEEEGYFEEDDLEDFYEEEDE